MVGACGGPAANGIAAKSAAAILASARAAAEGAQSLHLVVVMNGGTNQGTFEFDERMPSTAEVNVALANGQRYTILQVGTTAYIKADASYLATHGEASGAKRLADQCIETTIGPESASSVGVYATVRRFLAASLTAAVPVTKGTTSTVNGQSVIALEAGPAATLYVATNGTPYPVALKTTGGSVAFSGWGAAVAIAPFSPCQTLAQANASG